MKYVLYKHTTAWGLPSYSAASIQVEAYLRLAKAEVAAIDCCNSGSCPSGQLPALENAEGELFSKAGGEFESANHIIQTLKAGQLDLDAQLHAQEQAQAAAFIALMRNQLEPASLYTSWCEWESFSKHTRGVAGADLAVPLNYLTTWSLRRVQMRQYSEKSAETIYAQAEECYKALAAQLKGIAGGFLIGSKPCSADAFLYGHLVLHLSGPVTAPELRKAVEDDSVLRAYADRVAKVFSSPLPQAPVISLSPEWAERAEAASKGRSRPCKKLSEAEKERRRRNWLWLGAAAGLFATYVLFSGHVMSIEYDYDEDEEADEE